MGSLSGQTQIQLSVLASGPGVSPHVTLPGNYGGGGGPAYLPGVGMSRFAFLPGGDLAEFELEVEADSKEVCSSLQATIFSSCTQTSQTYIGPKQATDQTRVLAAPFFNSQRSVSAKQETRIQATSTSTDDDDVEETCAKTAPSRWKNSKRPCRTDSLSTIGSASGQGEVQQGRVVEVVALEERARGGDPRREEEQGEVVDLVVVVVASAAAAAARSTRNDNGQLGVCGHGLATQMTTRSSGATIRMMTARRCLPMLGRSTVGDVDVGHSEGLQTNVTRTPPFWRARRLGNDG